MSGGNASGGFGGNIFASNTTTTLDRVRVTGGSASAGGGVANLFGTMAIESSLIDSNVTQPTGAGDLLDSAGGGIVNFSGPLATAAALTLRNTTVAFNQANRAGAIINSGSMQNSMTLDGVTVVRNTAGAAGTGGIYNEAGLFAVGSSVVANNTLAAGGAFVRLRRRRGLSQGWNVESADQCGFRQEPDLRNSGDAGFTAGLTSSGGDTDVVLPALASPAVNIKTPGDCQPCRRARRPSPAGPRM